MITMTQYCAECKKTAETRIADLEKRMRMWEHIVDLVTEPHTWLPTWLPWTDNNTGNVIDPLDSDGWGWEETVNLAYAIAEYEAEGDNADV